MRSSANKVRGENSNSFFGSRDFRRAFIALLIPSVIQISISNFVNLLDDLMVGSLGTAQVSGVAIGNQLLFIFNLTVFGVLSATGIFGAQFFGAGYMKGVRNVFRAKVLFSFAALLAGCLLFLFYNRELISLFLKGEGEKTLAERILQEARIYLLTMLAGLPAFTLSQCYAGSMRESGDMKAPMRASIIAVLVNLAGNYVLIFGKIGFAPMGVLGAALSTVLARYVELLYLVFLAHVKKYYTFFEGVYRTLKVPAALLKTMVLKGIPLVVNEFLWALSLTQLNQIFSLRSLIVLAGVNINQTIVNFSNVVMIGISNSVAVLIGQRLGAGEINRAKREADSMMHIAFFCQACVGVALFFCAHLFPQLYNTEGSVKALAASFIKTNALIAPLQAVTLCSYYILRSGGQTIVTFLSDSVFNWVIMIPFALFLVKGTQADIETVYRLTYATVLLKCLIGFVLVKKGWWAKTIANKA